MKTLIALWFAVLASLCAAAPSERTHEELDIREATFRYQFGENASGQQRTAKAFYLAIVVGGKETDPDDNFLKRFADAKPKVKKVSECSASAERGVVDRRTGEIGLIFRTGPIRWVSDTEAEISGGYYEAGLSASGNTYHLKKVGGRWKVTKDVMHWIS